MTTNYMVDEEIRSLKKRIEELEKKVESGLNIGQKRCDECGAITSSSIYDKCLCDEELKEEDSHGKE